MRSPATCSTANSPTSSGRSSSGGTARDASSLTAVAPLLVAGRRGTGFALANCTTSGSGSSPADRKAFTPMRAARATYPQARSQQLFG